MTISDCLRQDGTDCLKCSEDFKVAADNLSCESTNNCLVFAGPNCEVCEYGYISDIGTGTCEQFAAPTE